MHLVVEDITEARAELVRRGVEVDEIQDFGAALKEQTSLNLTQHIELQEMVWHKGAKH